MTMYSQIVAILLLFCLPVSCQVKNYSLHRNDNDFATYKSEHSVQRDELPKELNRNISAIVTNIQKSIAPDKLDDYYIHKINVNDSIDIFVLSIESFSLMEHRLFLFNEKSNQISKTKIAINGKWAKNSEEGFNFKLMDLPNIEIKNQENESLLSIKERVHNGNSYDAVIQKHYYINFEKLTLDLKYCLEIKALGYDDAIIERLAEGNNVKVYKRDKNNIQEIGSFVLSKNMQAIVSKRCLDDNYCSQLITCSGLEDHIILNDGYLISY